jgi:hypothetical protein
MFPFSFIVFFPLVVLMVATRYREFVRIRSPLRVATYHPLLVYREFATYAYLFGLGLKLYTRFTDGTSLITANYVSHGPVLADEDRKLYIYSAVQSIESAWESHKDHINEFRSDGRQPSHRMTFEDYAEMGTEETDALVECGWASARNGADT